VQRDPERVRRRREEFRRDTTGDIGDATVRGDDGPVAVDDDCRIGLVRGQEPFERLPDGLHLALVERALAEDRGEAGRQEQVVALAQRDVEALGEVEDHLAARQCAPVSMKLRCRAETADRIATSSWLRLRRSRHSRSAPTAGARLATAMPGP
jgi:hypothetical protein